MHRTRFASLSLSLVASLLVACGGSVLVGPGDDAAGGSVGDGGADGTGGTSGDDGADGGTGGTGGHGAAEGGAGGSGGGAGDDLCEGLLTVFIAGMEVVDASGDGVWSPGERAMLWVTLGTSHPEGFFSYPGVRVSTTNPHVVPIGDPTMILFGVTADMPSLVPFEIEAMELLEPGATFALGAQVTSLAGDCSGAASDDISVTLEAPVGVD